MASDVPSREALLRELEDLELQLTELAAAEAVRQRARAQNEREAQGLAAVSRLAIDLAAAPPDVDLLSLIAQRLRDLTGAMAVALSLYEADRHDLVLSTIVLPGGRDRARLSSLLQRKPEGMRFPVTPEVRQEMLDTVLRFDKNLSAISFGAIPKAIAATVQQAFGIDHFAGLAFCHGGELLGSAVLVMPHGGQLPPDQVLRLFAHLAAVSLRRKRAEDALQRRNRDLERLNAAGQALNASLDQNQVLATALNQICALLAVDICSVWLLDRGSGELVCRCSAGAQADRVRGWRLSPGQGLAGWVAQTGRSVLVADAEADPRHYGGVDQATGLPMRSILCVPLRIKDDLVGVIQALDSRPGRLDAGAVPVVESLASAAGIALENARLYQDLRARLDELSQAQGQLVQAAKMAAFGQLAAGVAHELNTPLTSILGYSEMLLEHAPAEGRARPRLEAIGRQAAKARDIIRSLLDFARQQDYIADRADLNAVLRQSLLLVRQRLANSGITVREEYAPGLPRPVVDVSRLKQVFLNLCLNALQAMPRGGTLTVRSRRSEGGVAISFIDTGEGISPETLGRIFEPFFTTRAVDEGRGLGLSLSLGIVQAHGGRIDVQSQVGRGSTFTVWLPLEPPPHDERVLEAPTILGYPHPSKIASGE
jgi:signal transduction histidine kinase